MHEETIADAPMHVQLLDYIYNMQCQDRVGTQCTRWQRLTTGLEKLHYQDT